MVRWGGEEFLVVLPGSADATVTAEALREAIAVAEVPLEAGTPPMTASLGRYLWPKMTFTAVAGALCMRFRCTWCS